ncbi:MAG: hypothetical protein J2P21_07715 [Chloracidobacterium sp.]|nr:hypothetical protein [Chloracidobacterium sp.]
MSAKSRAVWRRAIEHAKVACAAAGMFGGVASATFGSVFTGASWFVANEGARRWLSATGEVLLFLTIPLLIIGGFCMDWLEKDNPKRDPKGGRYEYEDDDEDEYE